MADIMTEALQELDDAFVTEADRAFYSRKWGGRRLKKKLILGVVCLVLVMSGITIYAFNHDFFGQWGSYLGQHASDDNASGEYAIVCRALQPACAANVDRTEIYAVGQEVIVTKKEFEQAREFYVMAGSSEKEAEDMAYDYVLRNATLYAEALRNGMAVSEEEVDKKIEALKTMFGEAGNADELKKVMEGFASEEAYWEYEKTVYRKSLPIEKYRMVLERDFQSLTDEAVGTEAFQVAWQAWYKQYQDEKMEQQHFVRIEDIEEKELAERLEEFRR